MKQMSLIEMDGFLKGKCIPRDLKVNETNAEYLVRKFAEAEAKCAALAAENAGLKHAMVVTLEHVSVTDAGQAGVAAKGFLVHKVTPAADDLSQDQPRHTQISQPERVDLLDPAINEQCQECSDHTAVDRHTAVTGIEDA